MKHIEGGVTAAKGYKAASCMAGIKYEGRTDMALVYTSEPAVTAGVYTTNVVKAAPVKWDMKLSSERKTAKAMVFNSGIANACTGTEGDEINKVMAKSVADCLNIDMEDVFTASTGVIGMQLPKEKLANGAKLLAESLDDSIEAGTKAAKAIMTTDTVKKECAVTFEIQGKTVTMGGMTKGSGMIHPNMATMLCLFTTDLAISKELLQEALSNDVKKSFNMISVDRDTSTNDTYIIFANGLAGNPCITEKNEDYNTFCEALSYMSTTLAKMMAKDGEGASKLFETKVVNADTYDNAVILAKSVITSSLVKSAIFGNDANCGRFICALGYSGVTFDPDKVDLYLESKAGKIQVFKDGIATDYSEEKATEILKQEEVTAICDMKCGEASATAWGCDLTYDYVKINADYRS
ncbi:MAG: bifunctional ornithine acetyltransferase/N-acetylglutamate synthase [Lachnospiraceae bacterium]|nr:bifunctional ornithine acetyltransferase/N-acetylglutamate synthase [Lachnospiraceae bacterium]